MNMSNFGPGLGVLALALAIPFSAFSAGQSKGAASSRIQNSQSCRIF